MDPVQIVSGVVSGLAGSAALWVVYLKRIDAIPALQAEVGRLQAQVDTLKTEMADAHEATRDLTNKVDSVLALVGTVAQDLAFLKGRLIAHDDWERSEKFPTARKRRGSA